MTDLSSSIKISTCFHGSILTKMPILKHMVSLHCNKSTGKFSCRSPSCKPLIIQAPVYRNRQKVQPILRQKPAKMLGHCSLHRVEAPVDLPAASWQEGQDQAKCGLGESCHFLRSALQCRSTMQRPSKSVSLAKPLSRISHTVTHVCITNARIASVIWVDSKEAGRVSV